MKCLQVYQNSYKTSPYWRWWTPYTLQQSHQLQLMRENHAIFKFYSKTS